MSRKPKLFPCPEEGCAELLDAEGLALLLEPPSKEPDPLRAFTRRMRYSEPDACSPGTSAKGRGS